MNKEEFFRILAEHRTDSGGLDGDASVEISISGDDFVIVVDDTGSERRERHEASGQQIDVERFTSEFLDALVDAGPRLPYRHEIEFIPGSHRGRLTVSVDETSREFFFYADTEQRKISDFPEGAEMDALMEAIARLHQVAAPAREPLEAAGEPGVRTRE